MIDIVLKRYYGDYNVTKSALTVEDDGKVLFKCEARELGFVDYTDDERRHGIQYKCLPRGVFPLKVVTMPFNEACLKTHHTHTHKGTVIYGDVDEPRKSNTVLIGFANQAVAERWRKLERVEECRDRFNELIASLWGEEFRLVINN